MHVNTLTRELFLSCPSFWALFALLSESRTSAALSDGCSDHAASNYDASAPIIDRVGNVGCEYACDKLRKHFDLQPTAECFIDQRNAQWPPVASSENKTYTVPDGGQTIVQGRQGTKLTQRFSLHGGPPGPHRGLGSCLILRHLEISGMTATTSEGFNNGGAVYVKQASLLVHSCVFQENYAEATGGAIAAYNSQNVTIVDSKFVSNEARFGAAVELFLPAQSAVIRCVFNNNQNHKGGTIAVFADEGFHSAVVSECSGSGNQNDCQAIQPFPDHCANCAVYWPHSGMNCLKESDMTIDGTSWAYTSLTLSPSGSTDCTLDHLPEFSTMGTCDGSIPSHGGCQPRCSPGAHLIGTSNATCTQINGSASETNGRTKKVALGVWHGNCEPRHNPEPEFTLDYLTILCHSCIATTIFGIASLGVTIPSLCKSMRNSLRRLQLPADDNAQGLLGLALFLWGVLDLALSVKSALTLWHCDGLAEHLVLFACFVSSLAATVGATIYLACCALNVIRQDMRTANAHHRDDVATSRDTSSSSQFSVLSDTTKWVLEHRNVVPLILILSATRFSSLAVLRLRVCGYKIFNYPMEDRHLHFLRNAGIFKHLVADIPMALTSGVLLYASHGRHCVCGDSEDLMSAVKVATTMLWCKILFIAWGFLKSSTQLLLTGAFGTDPPLIEQFVNANDQLQVVTATARIRRRISGPGRGTQADFMHNERGSE
eukprot:COSAG02_NODE_167_length_31944_cov_19.552237_1_plen_715_part_00